MSGTIYSVETIAAHTGLSHKYLRKGDSSLKQVIATFPEISPDGVGLNDTGLMVFDDYQRYCSNKNGKPQMKFEEWKQLMIEEYGVKPMEEKKEEVQLTVVKDNSLAKLVDAEVVDASNAFDDMDDALEQLGNALAAQVGRSIKAKITDKVTQEANKQFREIQLLAKKIGKAGGC